MSLLAQQVSREYVSPGFFDNKVLDEYSIPVGVWADQVVDWVVVNLKWLLLIVKWPFENLIGFLVGDILEPVSWLWLVIAFFVIGTLAQNLKIGAFSAISLTLCGILGNNFWLETARTIGYIGVAVLLCAIIGLPLGVACGRTDATWRVVRPLLDGMQVIPSFAYMLPFVFFWSVGEVPATMVTMVFALPPLVRLTNLGIRQVPEDVVEASRAYGAPEWRVLYDVQLPLARPAIATGLNQTLLLAISMLGIAAIMGAGGLGRLLFQALSTLDIPKAMAAGLAFFLVAVMLDRISQPADAESRGLLRGIIRAWSNRRHPEALIPAGDGEGDGDAVPETPASAARFADVTPAERRWALVAAAGGILAAVSALLTWSVDGGFLSAYGRRADEQLPGETFSGLSASGGSWFGWLALALGLFVAAAAAVALRRPGRGPRWFAADGAVIASASLAVMMITYTLAQPLDAASGYSHGLGVYAGLIGALAAVVGAVLWSHNSPFVPLHPLKANIAWSRVLAAGIATAVVLIGAVSGWSFDGRTDVIISPEAQAELDELEQRARDNPAQAGVVASQVSALYASLEAENAIVTDGLSGAGPGLAWWTSLAALAGLAASLVAAGIPSRDESRQWRWSALTAGLGAGVAVVGLAWIFTHVRSADDNYLSGVGAFLTSVGGAVLVASVASVIREFQRTKVYADVVDS